MNQSNGTRDYEDFAMANNERLKQIFQRAARDPSGGSRVELFRALDGVELFFVANEIEVDGRPMWHTPVRQLADGSSAMLAYSSKRHPDLVTEFVGARWIEVLKAAYNGVGSDWLVIVNVDSETVAIERAQIPIIMADLQGLDINQLPGHRDMTDELEETITNSVDVTSDGWYEPALGQLSGRELYVHFTSPSAPGEQPSMQTSAAGGRDGWILSYTTRRRPGITYGGIKWEELVTMIKNNPELPGIRIVNDADDWIILGRDVI
jgi:hypothetical protein